MAKRSYMKTTIEDICKYWASIVDETELSVDAIDMHERCWNCGCKRKLDRCHIIPQSIGGEDIPSNYVLLCGDCHKDAPDCGNSKIMWDWIKSNKTLFYGMHWILKAITEYERIYGTSLFEELSRINIKSFDVIKSIIKVEMDKTSKHWGSCGLSVSTFVGVFRSVVTSEEFHSFCGGTTEDTTMEQLQEFKESLKAKKTSLAYPA